MTVCASWPRAERLEDSTDGLDEPAQRRRLVEVDSATAAEYVHGFDISDATVGFTDETTLW